METPREFADKMFGTKGMGDNNLSDFQIPLKTAIGMIETYCKKKDVAILKTIELFENYWNDKGQFYGAGLYVVTDLLKDALSIKKQENGQGN